MVASGYPRVIRIGPEKNEYVYYATTVDIEKLPVYRCGKPADHWEDTEGEVLYLLPLRPGWKAVHYHKAAVPGDVDVGSPVFRTNEDAVFNGTFKWYWNKAEKGEEENWEEMTTMFNTEVIQQ